MNFETVISDYTKTKIEYDNIEYHLDELNKLGLGGNFESRNDLEEELHDLKLELDNLANQMMELILSNKVTVTR